MSEYWTTSEDFTDGENSVVVFAKGQKTVKRFDGPISANNIKDIMRSVGVSQFKVYEQGCDSGEMSELNIADFPYDGNVVVIDYNKGA